ncbi:MAG: YihY/virulence factor BrkB family protein [Bacillus sp. (in: firmicutes)]
MNRGAAMGTNIIANTKSYSMALWKRAKEHDVSGMAAQLAFFFLLSLFPLLIFLITLVHYLPFTVDDILEMMDSIAPHDSVAYLEAQLSAVLQGNRGLLSAGIVGTLWTASNAMNGLLKAFDKAYDVKEQQTFFVRRLMALIFTVGLIFVFIIALVLPIFGKQIGYFLFEYLGLDSSFSPMWDTIRWVSGTVVLFLAMTVMYGILPAGKVKNRSIMRGALVATVGWIVVSSGFSFYVNNIGNYIATYGSIGGIIVLMLWFYLTAHIIIIGAEINAMNSERKKKVEKG